MHWYFVNIFINGKKFKEAILMHLTLIRHSGLSWNSRKARRKR